jgi:hypothetical protein
VTARKKTAFRDAPATAARNGVDPEQLADYLGGADIHRMSAKTTKAAPPPRAVREPGAIRQAREERLRAVDPDWTPPARKPRTLHTHQDLDFLDADDSLRGGKGAVLNVRLTAREKGALDFIKSRTPDSIHRICVEAIRDAINTRLRKLAETEI